MKTTRLLLASLVLGSGLASTLPALGQTRSTAATAQPAADTTGTNRSTAKGKEGSAPAVAQLGTALQLVHFARENESALAMLTAVQMIRQIQVTEDGERFADRRSEKAAESAPPSAGSDKKDESKVTADALDTVALLNEAKAWAKDDQALLAMIEAEIAKPDAKPAGTMGRVGGPGRTVTSVEARSIDTFTIVFRGGEEASIVVDGDGDTDLDLFVYDENGNEIVRDDDRTDTCVVRWTPRWTGKFTVRVANLGRVYNRYVMVTN